MKKLVIVVFILSCGIALSAYKRVEYQVEDVIQVLGIPRADAHTLIKENIFYASLNTPAIVNFKSIPGTKRVTVVNELGSYMKKYLASKEVADAYKEYRESLLPGRQEGINVKVRIEEIRHDIRYTEADKKSAPADMKKIYDETLTSLKSQLAILQNPNHPDYAVYAGIVEITKEQQEEINRQVEEFSKDYPEDVQQYLKLKLKEFLELTNDIDFNAKLIQHKGKWKFENPEYEAKDYNWKKCFRAGKETIETARIFAKKWILEIK